MSSPKVAITTLGCKTNQFESAAMAENLAKEGFTVVSFDNEAEFYIINTCTVTARTDAESRRLIRRAQRRNPRAKIVVTGCYAQVSSGELEKMPGVTLIIGNVEKKEIVRLLREADAGRKVLVSDIAAEDTAEPIPLETFAEHTRAFLQVQNGCNSFCSYCIVPYARGRSRSVSPEDALQGIASFSSKGFREVVLTGIHLSGYGADLTPPASLLQLLREAEERQLTQRLRLGSLEPAEIGDDLIDFIAHSTMVCPHLHIPLQSCNDEVLRRMNRPYTIGYFGELLQRLTFSLPDICIGIDIIAGFPGETEEEFRSTVDFLEALPVAYFHVFPFSSRPGTPAATMSGHISSRDITRRAGLLRQVSERKKEEYHRRFIGQHLRVLAQSQDENHLLKGLSRNYLPVAFHGPASLLNVEVPVKIESAANGMLYGGIVT